MLALELYWPVFLFIGMVLGQNLIGCSYWVLIGLQSFASVEPFAQLFVTLFLLQIWKFEDLSVIA